MAISEATIKNVKFPPELIPDSWFGNVPAGAEVTAPVLDLRRFKPYITELANIQVTANANVVLRARYDDIRVEENTAAMLSALVGAWQLLAKDILYLNFMGVILVANYTTHYGVWAFPPTIAHKLLLFGEWKNGKLVNLPLTEEEKAIADKHNIIDSVEKGVLPLPISQQIEREYHILGEETHSRSVNIAVANTTYTIENIHPKNSNEVVVLTRLAAAPGAAAQDVRLIADRDDDVGHAQLRTFPLSLVAGGEVECFIPAIREIRLTTMATVALGAHLFRYTFQRVKLTNTLRARFGLASKEELPGDVWEKVRAGVL